MCRTHLVPPLPPVLPCAATGESWGHAASTRVILHWGPDNERHAHLFKSPFLPPATARYAVTSDGIRNVPKEQ